jgi:hypothetical protein
VAQGEKVRAFVLPKWYSHDGYSHASISIDEEEEIFYSFNYKGFVIEKPKKRIPKTRKPENIRIRMRVSEEVYTGITKHQKLWHSAAVVCLFFVKKVEKFMDLCYNKL